MPLSQKKQKEYYKVSKRKQAAETSLVSFDIQYLIFRRNIQTARLLNVSTLYNDAIATCSLYARAGVYKEIKAFQRTTDKRQEVSIIF